jgi:hypothetical protein
VLKLRRSDVRDGFLHVEQNKTGAKPRIALEGELATLVSALTAVPARSLFLVHGSKGRPITAGSLRTRFEKAREAAGVDFQFRDLRAKAGTDAGNLADAQALLGHAASTAEPHQIMVRMAHRDLATQNQTAHLAGCPAGTIAANRGNVKSGLPHADHPNPG